MLDKIKSLMPTEFINAYDTLDSLRKLKDEWRYYFTDDNEFSSIDNIETNANVYWTEMLSRVHIITLVSIFKTLRWIEALDSTANNYYGFCTTLRGLIESLSDTYFTLSKVPLTLAIDYRVIKEQLDKNTNILTWHEKLENELLHYIQATKLSSTEKKRYPEYYNSKKLFEYIKSIDDDHNSIYNLYSNLCQISHPTYESTKVFLFLYNKETIVCNDSLDFESSLITKLVKNNSTSLIKIIRAYMNNLISVLLILNKFDIENLMTGISFEKEFYNTSIWKEVEECINKSELKYNNAIETNKYE